MVMANAHISSRDNNRDRDDDANDHIGSETPLSGIATPQPDPSDKRLPGIDHNSYFGQVGSGSPTCPTSGPRETPAPGSEAEAEPEPSFPFHRREKSMDDQWLPLVAPESSSQTQTGTGTECEATTSLLNERSGHPIAPENSRPQSSGMHPYPTPPLSQTPSLRKLKLSDSSSEDEEVAAQKAKNSPLPHRKSISLSILSRRGSVLNPLCSVVTTSNVLAAHFSNPSDPASDLSQRTPSHSRMNSEFHESPSVDRLKNLKLTDDSPRQKSIPATPTRALSAAKSDTSGGSDPSSGRTAKDTLKENGKANLGDVTPAQTSAGPAGAPAPLPKGKLTVKIPEARGLRKSRHPYVVAVFQMSELVSGGPLSEDEDDVEDVTSNPMGGIPIARQGSDSGRPMAIPMKSRQSSNTSLSDYRDFKITGRKSMTNPKWSADAVL